jgi:hypothetical protein
VHGEREGIGAKAGDGAMQEKTVSGSSACNTTAANITGSISKRGYNSNLKIET